jgi:hypothetical protein
MAHANEAFAMMISFMDLKHRTHGLGGFFKLSMDFNVPS